MPFSLPEVYDKVTVYIVISIIVFLVIFASYLLQHELFFAISIVVSFVGYAIIMFMYLLEKPPTKVIRFSPYLYTLSMISLILLLYIVCVKHISIPLLTYVYVIVISSCLVSVVPVVKLYTKPPCSKDLNSLLSICTSHAMRSRKIRNTVSVLGARFRMFKMLLKYGFIPPNIPTLSVNLLDRLTVILMLMFVVVLIPRDFILVKNLPYNDAISLCIAFLAVLMLMSSEYRYVIVIALKYWFQRYGVDLKGLTKRLWLLTLSHKVRGEDSKDMDLAFYRFKEFKDNIMGLELKLAYVNLITVLEVLSTWKLVKDRCVGEYIERKSGEIDAGYRCAITHSELRGALVHGARREGIDKDVKAREALFLLDPVCPIVDLIIVLNGTLNSVDISMYSSST